jgi:hypothetical protein
MSDNKSTTPNDMRDKAQGLAQHMLGLNVVDRERTMNGFKRSNPVLYGMVKLFMARLSRGVS